MYIYIHISRSSIHITKSYQYIWNYVCISNSVLLVKIGLGRSSIPYTMYHHLPVVEGVVSNPSINQPMGISDIKLLHPTKIPPLVEVNYH